MDWVIKKILKFLNLNLKNVFEFFFFFFFVHIQYFFFFYTIRFTHRKSNSIWSAINIKKVEELRKQGLMRPAGLAAFEKRKENKSRIYSYEKEASKLAPAYEKKFKANKKAWAFFKSLSPYYQKLGVHRVMDAKQEKTQISRLEKLIKESEAGRKP